MARRKGLPINQRHVPGCSKRDCDCPWSFRVRLPDGTMPRVTRDTYIEAEQAYWELMARRPELLADRSTTIAQWAARWLDSGPANGWRPTTVKARRTAVNLHIVPYLGDMKVTELRPDAVRLWVAGLRERSVGRVAVERAIGSLRTMYGVWQDDGRLLPAGIPIPRGLVKPRPPKEFDPLTTEQVAALAAAMPPYAQLIVTVEAFYGARVSEALALRDEDIRFTGKDVSAPLGPQLARLAALPADRYEARKPRLRFARKLEHDRTPAPIKNRRGNRTLPLPQWLAVALAEYVEAWPIVDGWLFVNRREAGGAGGSIPARRPMPWRQTTYISWLHRAAEAAGIMFPPNQASHAFRHHAVSVLRDKGWADDNIAQWIGDTAQTVTTVYGRPMADAVERIAAELSADRPAAGHRRLRAVDH
jgi:integrase